MAEKIDPTIEVLKGIQKEIWGLRSVLNEANRFDHERFDHERSNLPQANKNSDGIKKDQLEYNGKNICEYLASISASLSKVDSIDANLKTIADCLKAIVLRMK